MMAYQDLSVRLTPSGSWGVHASDGAVVVELPSKPQAITQAVSLLSRSETGGLLTVFDIKGSTESPIRVDSVLKSESKRPFAGDSRSSWHPRSGQQQPLAGPDSAGESDSENQAEETVKKFAEFADAFLGREEAPKTAGSELLDLSVTKLIPANRTVKMLNFHVGIGAAWCSIVALLLGGGTLSAAVAPMFQAAAGEATVGSYVTFFQAFFATFALSIAAMIVVYLFRENAVQGAGGLFVAAGVILAVVWLCAQLGIGGPSPQAMAVAVGKGGNPWTVVSAEFRVFSAYYGPAPYLAGLIVGALTGNIFYLISKTKAE